MDLGFRINSEKVRGDRHQPDPCVVVLVLMLEVLGCPEVGEQRISGSRHGGARGEGRTTHTVRPDRVTLETLMLGCFQIISLL